MYQSGADFRRALENRLRFRSLKTGIPLARLRKMVTFDRFLARLIQHRSEQWVLKGGVAIELRLVDKARTTKDIDILILSSNLEILPMLRNAGSLDLNDWFQFEITPSENQNPDIPGNLRYHIVSLLDGRVFEEFRLDVGIGDPIFDPIEFIEGPSLLDFLGIHPTIIPCYPITQQIAEKFHAITRHYASGESSRVKDFVDILLLAELGYIDPNRLLHAIKATFESRNTHSLPDQIPDPPREWAKPYQKLATQVSVSYQTLDEANKAMQAFFNPLLKGDATSIWKPEYWTWG